MKKTKLEKGITLIALIITIVVLLILAIVTIGAVKDSGIIKHAQDASNDYAVAQEKEQISLALSEWQIEKNIPGNTKTFKEVVESALDDIVTVEENSDGTLTVTMKSEKQYTVTESGEINVVKNDPQAKFLAFVQNTAQTTDVTIGDYKDIFAIKNVIKEEYPTAFVTISYSGLLLSNNSQVRRIRKFS